MECLVPQMRSKSMPDPQACDCTCKRSLGTGKSKRRLGNLFYCVCKIYRDFAFHHERCALKHHIHREDLRVLLLHTSIFFYNFFYRELIRCRQNNCLATKNQLALLHVDFYTGYWNPCCSVCAAWRWSGSLHGLRVKTQDQHACGRGRAESSVEQSADQQWHHGTHTHIHTHTCMHAHRHACTHTHTHAHTHTHTHTHAHTLFYCHFHAENGSIPWFV